jgi:tetratricopeptide (TPR) repeat protein
MNSARLALLTVVSSLLPPAAIAAGADLDKLMDDGHWKRARVLAEAAFKANPNDAFANYCMTRVMQRFGDAEQAVKYGETAVKLDPKSSAYHRALGDAYSDQIEKVSTFKQLGIARKMRAEFEAALAIDPKNPENILNLIEYFMQAPGMFGGDKKKAHQMADDEVKLNPAQGYLALARIAAIEKQENLVDGLYRKAVEADPKDYDARLTLAAHLAIGSAKDFPQAEQNAKAAIEANPDRIGGYRWLAYAVASQKRVDDAAKVIARAEAAIPDDISPYVYAARALLALGVELPRAEAWLKKYLAETKEPEPSAPLIAGAHWSLGLVYEKEGRKPEAVAELETSLRLKPDFEPAKKDLKRIK